ncbi:dTDP-4-dehydrorhamnose reductase [Pragia fontium]|uniref:dTDP-4-dehydrorhamnose reductase n=2 Tax=Pragia fontium TaxID=82985 RepID=A0AAJ4WBM1_9GAMM|nr:dTDP-4-dehydrorhamnose reductase [Pragia fontium]GKX63856.1 NAD(P)-dependent oxidoreductase [Pragia fontium]SFD04091.1 dTDP-4-dehydrorhamnose reductase [Pragia fontium DSM 5563 = ATCC 49100]VEJ56163.1 dTDP-4-dehydrorhamnose reductase [Pragia fontium]
MRVLLTGADGQLGRCFQDRVPKDWIILQTDAKSLDITDRVAVFDVIDSFKPNIIVNAAAYTAVDKAESDSDIATLVNVIGPQNLAEAALISNAKLIHVSTDYVFDGRAVTPYKEEDITNPLGVYGLTKLNGEQSVLEVNHSAIIIRTAWVFSEYGNNFVKTMLRLGADRQSLSIVADQRGCPTYAGDIARTIVQLIEYGDVKGGVYHYCGDKEVSWFEFAKAIFEQARNAGYAGNPEVKEITTDEYPTPAARPTYSVLDCQKIRQYPNISESDWQAALSNICRKLI